MRANSRDSEPRDFEREQREQELVHRVLSNTTELPAKFKDWITRWIESSGPRLSVNDAIGAYNQPRCRVYHNTTQAVSTGTVTTLTFNSERYDTAAMHDTTTNASRLTAPKPGVYQIGASFAFASGAAGDVAGQINVNGTAVAYSYTRSSSANTPAVTLATVWAMNLGDYAEVQAFQSTGSTVNVLSASSYSPEFHMTFLADYPRSN